MFLPVAEDRFLVAGWQVIVQVGDLSVRATQPPNWITSARGTWQVGLALLKQIADAQPSTSQLLLNLEVMAFGGFGENSTLLIAF